MLCICLHDLFHSNLCEIMTKMFRNSSEKIKSDQVISDTSFEKSSETLMDQKK